MKSAMESNPLQRRSLVKVDRSLEYFRPATEKMWKSDLANIQISSRNIRKSGPQLFSVSTKPGWVLSFAI